MADEIKNEANMDNVLDALAQGFGREERFGANMAGAEVFTEIMKPKIPESTSIRKGEKVHLRDALLKVEKPNGAVHVGFTSESMKGYIGRFQNDGWTPKDRTGKTHERVAGKHFWEATQREAKGKVSTVVAGVVSAEIAKKVGGAK